MTYTVTAKRWARGWELHIDGVGVTQARNLAEAEDMARDYIETIDESAPAEFAVDVQPEIEPALAAAAAAARQAVQDAERAQAFAAARQREVARRLKDAGLTGVDVAAYLGVSPQRVSQLAPDKRLAKQGAPNRRMSA